MLTHLQIRDFAIIDSIEVDFSRGLTVLTGETGAGKSILVDALQLAVGGRAGVEAIRHEAARAEITATFELSPQNGALRRWLEEQSIDADDELIIRRVITREGKSRAYLNGQQVPLQLLRDIGETLSEIHGQHEFQSLARPAAQRSLLDAYAGCGELADEVERWHRLRLQRSAALEELANAARDRDDRLELLRHQCSELAALDLSEKAIATLTEERNRLANSGRLVEAARHALELLYENDTSNAHAIASRAATLLRQAASMDPRLNELVAPLEEAVIRIAESASELTRYLDDLDADPARQEELEQRLAVIESLARKHRIAPNELAGKAAELAVELERLEKVEENLAGLQTAVDEASKTWQQHAASLGKKRRLAAKELAAEITARMQRLGMTGGRFEVEITPATLSADSPTLANGLEDINFLVSANAGQPPRPIGKVASGGELSRLSLAVQVALAARTRAQEASGCMVFDEVDSGVGGAVAEIVGRELALLGAAAQVLCVTHLPQVAALGDRHLRVSKLTDGRTTRTQIVPLEADSRIEEIARMLGGVAITDKAREHAAEMLEAGRRLSRRPSPSDAGSPSSGNGRKSRGRAR